MFQRTILGSLFLLALATPAFAKKEKDIVNADPATFPALRVEIEKDMRGDKYSELSQPDRARVSEALERMETGILAFTRIEGMHERTACYYVDDAAAAQQLLQQQALTLPGRVEVEFDPSWDAYLAVYAAAGAAADDSGAA